MKKRIFLILLSLLLTVTMVACGNKPSGEDGKKTEYDYLKGKVVYNIGKGNPPDLVFRSILKKSGVEYVYSDKAVEGKVALGYAAATEMAGLIESKKADYAIVGEPSATMLASKVGGKIVMDIQEEYGGGYPQALLVVKTAFLQANSSYVGELCKQLTAQKDWLKDNLAEGKAALIAAGSTASAQLSMQSVVNSKTVFNPIAQQKAYVIDYFTAMREVLDDLETDPSGGTPSDDFFADIPVASGIGSTLAEIYMPDGAPALIFSELFKNGFQGANLHIMQSPQIPSIISKFDVAVLPSHMAANLFSKGTPIKALAVVTNGNIYMVGK